jgi:hypothetical protein
LCDRSCYTEEITSRGVRVTSVIQLSVILIGEIASKLSNSYTITIRFLNNIDSLAATQKVDPDYKWSNKAKLRRVSVDGFIHEDATDRDEVLYVDPTKRNRPVNNDDNRDR